MFGVSLYFTKRKYILFVFFGQGQHDFQKGVVPLRISQSEAEQHEIENECLGMAVLAITHYDMNKDMGTSNENR